jgi:hypothetical protein
MRSSSGRWAEKRRRAEDGARSGFDTAACKRLNESVGRLSPRVKALLGMARLDAGSSGAPGITADVVLNAGRGGSAHTDKFPSSSEPTPTADGRPKQ